MEDMRQPKLLCKDITNKSHFWQDESGEVIPRHSVYYLIPGESVEMDELQEYLNSSVAQAWLEANCQRVANLRIQFIVLKKFPVPEVFGDSR